MTSETTPKDIGVVVAIPPDLKAWVDAQAAEIGVNAVIYIRMLVFAARREAAAGRAPRAPVAAPRVGAAVAPVSSHGPPAAGPDAPDPADAWRGTVDDDDDEREDNAGADIDAMVAERVAQTVAEQPYVQAEPTEMMARRPSSAGAGATTVPLRRPASRYVMPAHIAGGFA